VSPNTQGLPETAYFAVFDGHAGVEAAIYSKCHLLNNIIHHPLSSSDLNKAITEGITVTDKNFCVKAVEEVCSSNIVLYSPTNHTACFSGCAVVRQ